MKEKIEYSQRGGQFPYQAEGKIGKDYFYFRARGERISLELFKTKKDLEDLESFIYISKSGVNSHLNDSQADKIIRKLYKKLKA